MLRRNTFCLLVIARVALSNPKQSYQSKTSSYKYIHPPPFIFYKIASVVTSLAMTYAVCVTTVTSSFLPLF